MKSTCCSLKDSIELVCQSYKFKITSSRLSLTSLMKTKMCQQMLVVESVWFCWRELDIIRLERNQVRFVNKSNLMRSHKCRFIEHDTNQSFAAAPLRKAKKNVRNYQIRSRTFLKLGKKSRKILNIQARKEMQTRYSSEIWFCGLHIT